MLMWFMRWMKWKAYRNRGFIPRYRPVCILWIRMSSFKTCVYGIWIIIKTLIFSKISTPRIPLLLYARCTGRDFTVSGHCTPGFVEICSGIRILLLFFLLSWILWLVRLYEFGVIQTVSRSRANVRANAVMISGNFAGSDWITPRRDGGGSSGVVLLLLLCILHFA